MRRQRGSITPVWLALVLGTFLLFIVLVDREWVAYQLNKVEQTADFAAEAGAASAQITYYLTVHGVRHHWVEETVCDPITDPLVPPLCTTSSVYQPKLEDQPCMGDREALQGMAWHQTCGCDEAPTEGAWTCMRAELDEERPPQVWFPDSVDDRVLDTFHANWTDAAGARVTHIFPIVLNTTKRSARLSLQMIVSSVFGGERWLGQKADIVGMAIVQIPPLTLN